MLRHCARFPAFLLVVFLQHECILASGSSTAQSRREHLPHVCTELDESTWSPLLCRLHSAVQQMTELSLTSVNMGLYRLVQLCDK